MFLFYSIINRKTIKNVTHIFKKKPQVIFVCSFYMQKGQFLRTSNTQQAKVSIGSFFFLHVTVKRLVRCWPLCDTCIVIKGGQVKGGQRLKHKKVTYMNNIIVLTSVLSTERQNILTRRKTKTHNQPINSNVNPSAPTALWLTQVATKS